MGTVPESGDAGDGSRRPGPADIGSPPDNENVRQVIGEAYAARYERLAKQSEGLLVGNPPLWHLLYGHSQQSTATGNSPASSGSPTRRGRWPGKQLATSQLQQERYRKLITEAYAAFFAEHQDRPTVQELADKLTWSKSTLERRLNGCGLGWLPL